MMLRPWVGFAVLWVVTCSLVGSYPPVPIGPVSVTLPELVLAVSLVSSAAWFVRWRRPTLGIGWFSLLVGLLLLAFGWGVAVGYLLDVPLRRALLESRWVVYYAAFWPATIALATPIGRRRVAQVAGALSVLALALHGAQISLGGEVSVFYQGSVEVVREIGDGVVRVRGPGLVTAYVVAAFAMSLFLWGPRGTRVKATWLALASSTAVLLSLYRNMLLGLILCYCVAVAAARRPLRALIAGGLAAVAVALVAYAAAPNVGQGERGGFDAVLAERLFTRGSGPGSVSTTLGYRLNESSLAWDALRPRVITGIGFGSTYGATRQTSSAGLRQKLFVHNQYLWVWMRAGVVGLVLLLTLLAATGVRGWRAFRSPAEPGQEWIGAGVLAAVAAVAVSSTVEILLSAPSAIVPLMAVIALAALLPHMSRTATPGERVRERRVARALVHAGAPRHHGLPSAE